MTEVMDEFRKNTARLKRRAAKKSAGRLDAFRKATEGSEASWGDCDPGLLQSVVVTITALGGAITVGLSRDQSARFLTLLLDDAKKTFWYEPDDDLDDKLRLVLGTLEAMIEE